MNPKPEIAGRTPEADVHRWFLERRSTRAFSPEPLQPAEIASLFEAARWAPSCFNDQPWRFVYGVRDEDRERFFGLLAEGNVAWARTAPLVGVVFARRHFGHNGKPNRWGPFDAGAASMSLALQAHAMGLAAHFMGGFDAERSHAELGVPAAEWQAMAAFVVGRPGDPAALPDALREREAPTGRKPHAEVADEGSFEAGTAP